MARILVFDRKHERHAWYREALIGHEITATSNLLAAVKIVVVEKPQLIISDWHESDGAYFLEELRKLRNVRLPHAVLVDEVRGEEQIANMLKMSKRHGAEHFIPRNVQPYAFLLLVNAACFRAGVPVTTKVADVRRTTMGTDDLLDAVRPSPYAPIVELLGGWEVFNRIIDAHKIRSRRNDLLRLREEVIGWGELDPAEQIIQATYYTYGLTNRVGDKVEAVLYDMANEILFGSEAANGSRGN